MWRRTLWSSGRASTEPVPSPLFRVFVFVCRVPQWILVQINEARKRQNELQTRFKKARKCTDKCKFVMLEMSDMPYCARHRVHHLCDDRCLDAVGGGQFQCSITKMSRTGGSVAAVDTAAADSCVRYASTKRLAHFRLSEHISSITNGTASERFLRFANNLFGHYTTLCSGLAPAPVGPLFCAALFQLIWSEKEFNYNGHIYQMRFESFAGKETELYHRAVSKCRRDTQRPPVPGKKGKLPMRPVTNAMKCICDTVMESPEETLVAFSDVFSVSSVQE